MVKTAINLYSVRELDLPMAELLERVADAGYDGVQFSGGLRDATPGEISATAADLDLAVTPAHVDVDAMESDPAGVAETYRTIGTDGVVVPWIGPEEFATREAAERTADRVDAVAASMAEHGFDVHYHNHAHEFAAFDGTTGMDAFVTASSVLLEPDVGWLQTGGRDPVEFLEAHGDRIEVVHMKDMADGEFAELGEGDVDVQACADAARAIDAEWLVYEHDEPADPAASIDTGADVLAGL